MNIVASLSVPRRGCSTRHKTPRNYRVLADASRFELPLSALHTPPVWNWRELSILAKLQQHTGWSVLCYRYIFAHPTVKYSELWGVTMLAKWGQSEAITRGRQVVMLMGCTQCAEFAHENYNWKPNPKGHQIIFSPFSNESQSHYQTSYCGLLRIEFVLYNIWLLSLSLGRMEGGWGGGGYKSK